MRRDERCEMPWHGPDEPAEVSALHDDQPWVLLTGEGWDDPSAPWHVVVTWREHGGTWRPAEVGLRSSNGEPVTASLWRQVPVTRAIRWSAAYLSAKGALASDTTTGGAEAFAERQYDASSTTEDGRVRYDEEHWDRVVEAWNAVGAVHARRREVAKYLRRKWPDDPRYTGITNPKSTAVRGWLDRLTREGRIDRSQKGGTA